MKIHLSIFASALWVLISGCGPSEYDKMVESTRRQFNASEVKTAALPLFALTNISSTNLPNEITALPLFVGDGQDITCWRVKTNTLAFMTGGGFGHWGLLISQPGFESQAKDSLHAVVSLWGDGVFFWREL